VVLVRETSEIPSGLRGPVCEIVTAAFVERALPAPTVVVETDATVWTAVPKH